MTDHRDLVDRLRATSRSYDRFAYGSVLLEAAAAIEQLEGRVAELEAAAGRDGQLTA